MAAICRDFQLHMDVSASRMNRCRELLSDATLPVLEEAQTQYNWSKEGLNERDRLEEIDHEQSTGDDPRRRTDLLR